MIASDAIIRDIMGAIGSGKAKCAPTEFMRRGGAQAPFPPSGPDRERFRPTRFYCIRDTYRYLKKLIGDNHEGMWENRIPGWVATASPASTQ